MASTAFSASCAAASAPRARRLACSTSSSELGGLGGVRETAGSSSGSSPAPGSGAGNGSAPDAAAPSGSTAGGSGTTTAPTCSQVRPPSSGARAAGTAKLIRHIPGPAPLRLGGSGMAGNRNRRPAASTTSTGCALQAGRRRRQRPVTRTVTFSPPSASHSTDSIPSTDGTPGGSVIVRDGMPSSGRTRLAGNGWRRSPAHSIPDRHPRNPRGAVVCVLACTSSASGELSIACRFP